jgi:tRNA dimethylallyltransferase
MNKLLIVIQGPTASGKTALSIALAKKYNTEVFSADSRQFYKELTIGTAKPTLEEMEGVVHHFVGSHSIHDKITAASYLEEALPLILQRFGENDILILVGGSGLYIDALCYGLDDLPTNQLVKNELIAQFEIEGLTNLLAELKEKDEVYFNQVDKKNSVRIIRALEVIRVSNKPYSSFLTAKKRTNHSFDIIKVTIDLEREVLYERINKRVDQMIEASLEDEVKSLVEFKTLQALQTVGYSEWFPYFNGQISFNDLIDQIKQNTRRYAKRQLTWFRRDQSAIWLKGKELFTQLDEVELIISKWNNGN